MLSVLHGRLNKCREVEASTYVVVVVGCQGKIYWEGHGDFYSLKDYSGDIIVDGWKRVRLEAENHISQEAMES